jgi:hypothetical protein
MEVIHHSSSDGLLDLQIQSDEQALQDSLVELRSSARKIAERPEDFWQRQNAAIRARVGEAEGARRRRIPLVWAAAVLLACAGAALLRGGPAPKPVVQTRPAVVTPDSDQQLLIAVEHAVQNGVPDSLEPAAYLAEQIGQASRTASSSEPNKEAVSDN